MNITREDLIEGLEDLLDELRSGMYSDTTVDVTLLVAERRLSRFVSEDIQIGKQIFITLKKAGLNGN